MRSKELLFLPLRILKLKRLTIVYALLVNLVAVILYHEDLKNVAILITSIGFSALFISLQTRKTEFCLFGIFFVIFTYFFPISNLLRFLLLLALFLIVVYREVRNNKSQLSINLLQFFYVDTVLLVITIFVAHIEKAPLRILQFLSFGYDNALHFSLFRVYSVEQEFAFGLNAHWTNDFGLFKTYPPGYSALWSFFYNNSFGVLNSSVGNLLSSFFILNLCLIVVITLQGANLVLQLLKDERISKKSVCVLIAGPIFYFWGILLTNGFEPYLLGVLVILLFTRFLLESHSDSTNLLMTAATGFILISTTPAVSFIVVPSGGYFLYQLLLKGNQRLRIKVYTLFLIAIATVAAYLVYSHTTKTFGWRQMLGSGGVQPPNIYISIAISVFCLYSLFRIPRVRKSYLTAITLFTLGLSVVIYSGITYFLTGSIQYYAIKQGILFLGLESIFVVAFLLYLQSKSAPSSLNRNLIKFLCIFWLIMFAFGFQNPRTYTGAFMGNVLQTPKAAFGQNSWQTEIVDSRQIIDVLRLDPGEKNTCLILHLSKREGDLNSRWLNALRGSNSITQDCFMAFWNSTKMTLNEIYSQKIVGKYKYYVFIDPEKNATNSGALPSNVELIKTKFK